MQAWEAVQSTLDYMEEHYEEELTIEQLSSIAHLSRFYYQRLFYRLVGSTVSDYLRNVRLKKAAEMLKDEHMKIMEIALQCGFSSHSALTRAFRLCYGISPREYRTSNVYLDHVIKPCLELQYTIVDEGVPLICDDMILEIHRRVQKDAIWFCGFTKENESAGIAQPKENTLVKLWECLEQDAILQRAALDEGDDILTPSQTPGVFTYMAAVQTAEAVEGYASFQMPPGTYVVCEYEAESFEQLVQEALYKASAYLFEVWLPKHGYQSDAFLVQRYLHPKQKDSRIQLWVRIEEAFSI